LKDGRKVMPCPQDGKPCDRPFDENFGFACGGTYRLEEDWWAEDGEGNPIEFPDEKVPICPRWKGVPGGGFVVDRRSEHPG
jgi:hypothetical protein